MIHKLFFFIFLAATSPLKAQQTQCKFEDNIQMNKEILDEIKSMGTTCHKKDIHLTFDDGPSIQTTPKLLEILNKRNVKASFFVTTTNLDSNHKNSKENLQIVNDEINSGHLIANHGHHHDPYDVRANKKGEIISQGMSPSVMESEIQKSTELLNKATSGKFSKQAFTWYRLPYGRGAMPSEKEIELIDQKHLMKFNSTDYKNRLNEYRSQSPALQILSYHNYSHLAWNHDSEDSSYGSGEIKSHEIKKFILNNIKNLCHGDTNPKITLFHDIKKMNLTAIPSIIDIGRCLGLNFISPNEIIRKKKELISSHVLIESQSVKISQVDNLTKILNSLNGKSLNCDENEETHKSCFSKHTQKTYNHCQGSDSVCFDGKWYAKNDPLILENCP